MTPTPEITEILAAHTEALVRTERERAAALVRAYADTRPAGEAYALVRLAHTIETGTRHTIPAQGHDHADAR